MERHGQPVKTTECRQVITRRVEVRNTNFCCGRGSADGMEAAVNR
jgi:hypothetical protein